MMVAPPACMDCKHFLGARKCDAFPDRIPDVIWLEGDPHTEPAKGDHGIRFKAKDDATEDDDE